MNTNTPQCVSSAYREGSKAGLSYSSRDLAGVLAFNISYLIVAEVVILAVFGTGPTVISLLAGIPLTCISMTWEARLSRKSRESNEGQTLISALSVAYSNMRHNQKPLLSSLTKAIESTSASMVPITYTALSEVTN